MSNYLRNRPFMVISYTYVLKAGQKSNTPGFGQQAEFEPVENMVIVDRVSSKQTRNAELILDLLEQKVILCRDDSLDKEKLFNVFVERHYEEVKAALATWVAQNSDNLEMMRNFLKAQVPVTTSNDETNPDTETKDD